MEIDSTFYATPSRQTARHWLEVTPDDFTFSCKLPREITHERKLRGCREPLAAFLHGLEPLFSKLGVVLIQLPPYAHPRQDETALREFLPLLPATPRFAVEFREPAWHVPRIAHLLEQHRVCWAWNDLTPLNHQTEGPFEFLPQTTDFLYLRLMGDLSTKYDAEGRTKHRYTRLEWPREGALESWTIKLRQHFAQISRGFVFTSNHFEGFSPQTACRFAERLGITIQLPVAGEWPSAPADPGQLELPF